MKTRQYLLRFGFDNFNPELFIVEAILDMPFCAKLIRVPLLNCIICDNSRIAISCMSHGIKMYKTVLPKRRDNVDLYDRFLHKIDCKGRRDVKILLTTPMASRKVFYK